MNVLNLMHWQGTPWLHSFPIVYTSLYECLLVLLKKTLYIASYRVIKCIYCLSLVSTHHFL